METIGDFLKELRGKMSFREASEKTGLSHSYIRYLEIGKRPGSNTPIKPTPETLKSLAKAYNYSYDELMRKAGYLDKKDLITKYLEIQNADKTNEDKSIYGISDEFEDIPILGTIRAGQVIDRIDHYEGTYPVLKRTINGYDAFWLKVKGESMSGDEIHDGDLVCVIVTTEVNSSDIAAVAVNRDEATLKRVKCQGDMCMLNPSNPSMEPMLVPSKDVHIIGKVVGFQRYFK